MVRALLSSEIGTRAAEGNIGRVNRWFAGTQHIDEVEALCVELLKVAFRCSYADHRLMGSMLGNMAVYHALTQPGDVIMSAPQPFGGHSSNRYDGPAGMRGYRLGRFVDSHHTFVRAEVRFPIVWRFRGSVGSELGFVYGDSPCVMCWEQRVGMALVALVGLFVLRYGPKPKYIGMAVLVAAWGVFMGVRHTAMHAARHPHVDPATVDTTRSMKEYGANSLDIVEVVSGAMRELKVFGSGNPAVHIVRNSSTSIPWP